MIPQKRRYQGQSSGNTLTGLGCFLGNIFFFGPGKITVFQYIAISRIYPLNTEYHLSISCTAGAFISCSSSVGSRRRLRPGFATVPGGTALL
ncbi:hypothetical protein F4861DRAFT_491407 [Xylaria intraflava]|nr:hypothetical protein F4861DRAFT_491407 [Xylaria intraflava]